MRIYTPAKPGAAPGDLFLAPYQGKGTPGPMITDQEGNLVWFKPLPSGESATNLKVVQLDGQPALTWWQGRILEVGFGQGEWVLANSSYQQIGHVRAGNGYHADLHEIRVEPNGTAWIDAFDPIHMNLSSLHGESNGVLTDSVVQEIDIKTGLVMWEWHALGNIPISESHNPAPKSHYPWDYVHINSISPGTSGDVLLSSRNTWTLYDVEHPQRRDQLAAGRLALELQAGGGHALLLAARRRVAAGRADLGVRQRLDPAEGEAVARAAARTEPRGPHGDPASARSRTPRARCSPRARATRSRCPAATG